MNVRDLDEDWADEWDRFCKSNSGAWFWHSTDWLDYSLAHSEADDAQEIASRIGVF